MAENVNEIDEVTEEVDSTPAETPRVVPFEEALEAILFAAGHPVSYSTLARVFEMTPSEVKLKVFEYSMKYNKTEIPRGVILIAFSDSCQLCTKEYYLPEIRNALGIKKSGSLSTSSMEALAIVAYNQPVTRVFVDTLRRVDSSYAMNNLIDRGLIESKGRMDAPGRPMLYGTTTDFLRCFGLKELSELPATSDELMEVFDKAKIQEQDKAEGIDENDAQSLDDINEIENAPQIEMVLDELDEPSADENITDDE